MELKVKKKQLANLSKDLKTMPVELTAEIAGGTSPGIVGGISPEIPDVQGHHVRRLTRNPTEYRITY